MSDKHPAAVPRKLEPMLDAWAKAARAGDKTPRNAGLRGLATMEFRPADGAFFVWRPGEAPNPRDPDDERVKQFRFECGIFERHAAAVGIRLTDRKLLTLPDRPNEYAAKWTMVLDEKAQASTSAFL